MKSTVLILLALVVSGCSTAPRDITDVQLYDKLKVNDSWIVERAHGRSEFADVTCSIKVYDIMTAFKDREDSTDVASLKVCGTVTCNSKETGEEVGNACLPFDAVKAEQSSEYTRSEQMREYQPRSR